MDKIKDLLNGMCGLHHDANLFIGLGQQWDKYLSHFGQPVTSYNYPLFEFGNKTQLNQR